MMDNDTKWVVFIDALSPNDLSRTDFMPETMQGRLDAGVPRVTPSVMSSVYTGMDPAETGMSRIHAHGQPDVTRPQITTTIERAQANGLDVLNLYMPYCIPQNVINGSAAIGTAAGEQSGAPQQLMPQLTVPGPTGDLVGESRHDIVFDHFVDYTSQLFSTARTLSPDFDVVFIGFRLIDSYCHFQYDTGIDGRHAPIGERYRDKLAEVVDIQLQQLEPRGDVFWFSDHGATQRTETFYVNKWLAEKGYLEYEVNEEFIEEAQEYGLLRPEGHPVDERVENQAVIGGPGVSFDEDESQAICGDAYDSCITLLDESIQDELVSELSSLDVYRGVHTKEELFNEDGEFFDDAPHILPDRDEGVFVSGSVHPDPIGMGWYRTGVHDRWGCYGSTTDLEGGEVTPVELNGVREDFLELEREVNPVPGAISRVTPEEKEAIKKDWS